MYVYTTRHLQTFWTDTKWQTLTFEHLIVNRHLYNMVMFSSFYFYASRNELFVGKDNICILLWCEMNLSVLMLMFCYFYDDGDNDLPNV